jgi:hypothetical protein
MITLRTEAIAKKTPDSVPKLAVSSITDNALGSNEDIQNENIRPIFTTKPVAVVQVFGYQLATNCYGKTSR